MIRIPIRLPLLLLETAADAILHRLWWAVKGIDAEMQERGSLMEQLI